jgi:hypothetical protein
VSDSAAIEKLTYARTGHDGYKCFSSRQIVDYFLSVTIPLQAGKSVIRQLPGEVIGQMS